MADPFPCLAADLTVSSVIGVTAGVGPFLTRLNKRNLSISGRSEPNQTQCSRLKSHKLASIHHIMVCGKAKTAPPTASQNPARVAAESLKTGIGLTGMLKNIYERLAWYIANLDIDETVFLFDKTVQKRNWSPYNAS